MNQKNIFTVIAAFLLLQGLGMLFMGSTIAMDAFGDVGASGNAGLKALAEVMGALSIIIGLVVYNDRTNSTVLGPLVVGVVVLLLVTVKHKFFDGINVPIWALGSQILIFLAVVYLWWQNRNKS